MKGNDIRGSNTFTHNHNYLIKSITFEVHHITPTSPRNTLVTILKALWFFLFFMFFAYFSFKHIMHGHIWEKRKYPIMYDEYPDFVVQVLHLIEHSFYELHIDVLRLISFSGEMVIYAFLLGFFSPSRQKEWFKIWKIKD